MGFVSIEKEELKKKPRGYSGTEQYAKLYNVMWKGINEAYKATREYGNTKDSLTMVRMKLSELLRHLKRL